MFAAAFCTITSSTIAVIVLTDLASAEAPAEMTRPAELNTMLDRRRCSLSNRASSSVSVFGNLMDLVRAIWLRINYGKTPLPKRGAGFEKLGELDESQGGEPASDVGDFGAINKE